MDHFYPICEIVQDCKAKKLSLQEIDDIKRTINKLSEKKLSEPVDDLKRLKKRYFKSYGKAPDWYKKSVYYVVESQLFSSKNKSQTSILKILGLPNDVFSSDFQIYSPDFRKTHLEYRDDCLEFMESEVDCNRVYRAMLHYIIGYADTYTDTFVDVFGHLGLVPMISAWGYKKRYCIVDNMDRLNLFQKGLKSIAKLFKEVQKIQCTIDSSSNIREELENQFGYRTSIIQYNDDKLLAYEYAADFIYSYMMRKQYWIDSNLEEEYGVVLDEVKDICSRNVEQYHNFCNLSKDDIELFGSSYKYVTFRDDYPTNISDKSFLYINLPAYIREYKRFNFSDQLFQETIDAIKLSEGNFIITWKNYVSSSKENKYKNIHDESSKRVPPNKMLEKILELEKLDKPLYLFEFIDSSGSRRVYSTKFITNIDFKEIDVHEFDQKYGMQLQLVGDFRKVLLKDFIKKNAIGRK